MRVSWITITQLVTVVQIIVFLVETGNFMCASHRPNDCFSFENCSFWFWLKWSSILYWATTRDKIGACANCIKLLLHVTRKVYLFLYWRQKVLVWIQWQTINTALRHAMCTWHFDVMQYLYLSFFVCLPLQLKFTYVSVQQLWQNLFRLVFVFERNGSQLPATRRFISNELYSINRSCTWFYWLRFWVGVLNKFKIIQIPWAMTKKILVFFTVQN